MGNILNKLDEIKGEFVIVVEGNNEIDNYNDMSLMEHIELYISQDLKIMDAIKQVAKERNMKKSDVYAYYQKEKEKGDN